MDKLFETLNEYNTMDDSNEKLDFNFLKIGKFQIMNIQVIKIYKELDKNKLHFGNDFVLESERDNIISQEYKYFSN